MQAIPDKGVKPKLTRMTGASLEAKNAQIAQLANNPPEVAGQLGMREQYVKPKGGIGPGGFNWLYNTKGEEAAGIWKDVYGEKNVPYKQVEADYIKANEGPKPANMPKNLNAGTPKYIPNYIKGGISPEMAMGIAGNVLGGLGIYHSLKEGDTASAGLGAVNQLLANASMLAGKQGALGTIGAAAGKLSPFMMGMTPTTLSSGTLNSPEAKALFKKAKSTGIAPPSR